MVKRIDSDALETLNAALGLTGPGSQITELNDGVVDQSLDLTPIVRRGRTLARSSGIFVCVLRNDHLGNDTITTTINPYDIGTVAPIPPWPASGVMPPSLDIWLLYATTRLESGTISGTLATLDLRHASNRGFGIDSAGAQVLVNQRFQVAFWDTFLNVSSQFGLLNGANGPLAKIGIRIPRSPNSEILFSTFNGAAALGLEVTMILGVFPVGLGQDGIR